MSTTVRRQGTELNAVTHGVLEVHDLQVWLVPQRIDLRPEQRDAAPDLHKAQLNTRFVAIAICGLDDQDLLSLDEVGNMAVAVDTTTEVARAGSVARTATDEA